LGQHSDSYGSLSGLSANGGGNESLSNSFGSIDLTASDVEREASPRKAKYATDSSDDYRRTNPVARGGTHGDEDIVVGDAGFQLSALDSSYENSVDGGD
jgi:hypothetical protein